MSKRFPVGDGEVEALAPHRRAIDQGQFVCLIGASGCGKSTMLRIIAGFEEPTSGEVSVDGKPITGPGSDRGMVFQDYALFPWMTVRQNIGFGPRQRRLPRSEIEDIADEFVKLVGLERFANRYPNQLSGGMKQRVAIARVLANDANILLMDEPFGALDALTREQLQRELLQIWARTWVTIVFVTHSVEEAALLADRVLVMSAGTGPDRKRHHDRAAAPARCLLARVQRGAPRPRATAHQPYGAEGRSNLRIADDGGSSAAPTALYRGMDRATLDAAYNNTAAVADSAAISGALARAQRRAPRRQGGAARPALWKAGRAPGSTISPRQAQAPLFVFIHGGYWQRNDKDMFAFVADGPRAHRIDVAVVGYTLAPEARLGEIVEEINQR